MIDQKAQINYSPNTSLELVLSKKQGEETYKPDLSEIRKKENGHRRMMYLQVFHILRIPTTEKDLRHILEIDNSASVRYTRELIETGLVRRLGKPHDRVKKPKYVSTIKSFSIEYIVGNPELEITTKPRATKTKKQNILKLF